MSFLTLFVIALALIVVGLLIALWSCRTQLRESRRQEAIGERLTEQYMNQRDDDWRELERAKVVLDAVRRLAPKITRAGHIQVGAASYRLMRDLKGAIEQFDQGR